MSNIKNNITEVVGNTPLVRLSNLKDGLNGEVLLKLENMNPLSSVKDRIALNMILEAEKTGRITHNSLIIEPTSGNTGIGLAFVGASRGYRIILTMPDTMSDERKSLLKALGAELVLTPGAQGMKGAIKKAEELAKVNPDAFMPQQFQNPANPDAHRKTTAVEIWNDTDGQVDYLVAGVGTGGTLTGCAEYLKEKNPQIQIIAVEPVESAVLSGEGPGAHKIQGIGAGFVPAVLNTDVINEIIKVKHTDAGEVSGQLAQKEGILCGISAGANVWAAMEVAKRPEAKGKNIVTFICDTGERYLSTWLFSEK